MRALTAPVKYLKRDYLPLLAVYFTTGLAALSSVASTFFSKNNLHLSAADMVLLGIFTSLPWSTKILLGSIVDNITLLGSRRTSYIHLANTLTLISVVGTVDHASSQILITLFGEFTALLMTGVLGSLGVVISDIVADTMAIELVPPGPEYEEELAGVQIWSRLALIIGSVAAAVISGPLAAAYTAATVFSIVAICPVISSLVAGLIPTDRSVKADSDYKVFIPVLSLLSLYILAGLFLGEYASIGIALITLFNIGIKTPKLLREMPSKKIAKSFVFLMLAVFLFRATPGAGPSVDWWYIEALKFDEKFFGLLRITGTVVSLIALWLLTDFMTRANTVKVIIWLTILMTIFSLPDLMIFYKINELIGVSARHLVLFDSAALSILAQLAMIPLGTATALHAPKEDRATYLAVTASLMNLALMVGDILSMQLNKLFIVTRTDFTQLGLLLTSSLVLSTLLSLLGLGVMFWSIRKND